MKRHFGLKPKDERSAPVKELYRRTLEQLSAAQTIGRRLNERGEKLLRWLRKRYGGQS